MVPSNVMTIVSSTLSLDKGMINFFSVVVNFPIRPPVLLYSCKKSQSQEPKAETLLQLRCQAPSSHLPRGFEVVWTFISGSNLSSSTALLVIGKDPGGRGHLIPHTVSSVTGAVIRLKRHTLLYSNPIFASYQVCRIVCLGACTLPVSGSSSLIMLTLLTPFCYSGIRLHAAGCIMFYPKILGLSMRLRFKIGGILSNARIYNGTEH